MLTDALIIFLCFVSERQKTPVTLVGRYIQNTAYFIIRFESLSLKLLGRNETFNRLKVCPGLLYTSDGKSEWRLK